MGRYHTVVLSNGGEEGVELEAAEEDTRLILMCVSTAAIGMMSSDFGSAGEPLAQQVVQHGPFGAFIRRGIGMQTEAADQ